MQSESRGYHSSPEVKNKNCWKCHSEHNGRDFRIINFFPDKFDHDKAGFKLTGTHASIKCGECHRPKFITNSLFNKRKNTYIGLGSDCISCHKDIHQNTLGKNCASCHNTVKFKPAVFFDHDTSGFKLDGAHLKTACDKCHIKETLNGKPFQKFAGIPFKECSSCHKDVHRGRFGVNCGNCHNTLSFTSVNKNSFDHGKTKFPLLGAHSKVICSDCHGKNPLSRPKFAECTDCHKDAHFGEFTSGNIVEDCKKCHSVDGFDVALFTLTDHDKSDFRLTGAHLAVSCRACHYMTQSGKKVWHFKNIGIKCIDCHKNVHGTEIEKKFMPGDNCGTCHTPERWNKISFNHDLSGFKLSGKHAVVRCDDCHKTENKPGEPVFKFASLSPDCSGCHRDIHFGQFKSAAAGGQPVCENCHGFDNWKPEKFNHENTSFPLKGAHENVPCSGCHKVGKINGNVFIIYKMENFKCASCHA